MSLLVWLQEQGLIGNGLKPCTLAFAALFNVRLLGNGVCLNKKDTEGL